MSDCIEWSMARNSSGYGVTWRSGKTWLAHRLALLDLHVPIAGMIVRHHCDNPPCINPEHLTVGTHQDNAQDMLDRGRSAREFRRWNCKLTETQVKEIKHDPRLQRIIADEYQINQSLVSRIKHGVRRKEAIEQG